MKFINYCSVLIVLICFIACTPEKEVLNLPQTDLSKTAFIPWPSEIRVDSTAFPLDSLTPLLIEAQGKAWEELLPHLQSTLQAKTGWSYSGIAHANRAPIVLKEDSDLVHEEGYEIRIQRDSIVISAGQATGAYRALQTLGQAIPDHSNDTLAARRIFVVPAGKISDAPRFAYRGMMLDVARHFFSVEEVKKLIDQLSRYKINYLHLHLSDDQGWRIEIDGWPELTGIGAATEVGGGAGGFYTKGEFRELVAYAKSRYITIVPEIDMPGHTNAAVVSYPIFNGNGKQPKPYTGTRVGFSTLAARKDTTYTFLKDVINQISDLTDGPYFHVGGDESHVTKKEDYIYFLDRVQPLVQAAGKTMMGWDEIVQANLDSQTVLQHWRTSENALEGAKKGMKIVMSPASHAYLDMKYDENSAYGLDWAGLISVEKGYSWDPAALIPELPEEAILGIEAPLWSETISNSEELEYLAFPRLVGYAELGWSQKEHLNWESYLPRLKAQLSQWQKEGINYYKAEEFLGSKVQ